MSLTSATDLLAPLWAQTNTRYAILLIVAAGVFFVLTRGSSKQTQATSREPERAVRRPTNTGAFRRFLWRLRPPHDLMRVDGLAIDRTRKPHMAWLGPTGAGKSTAVATTRVDGKRPTFIVTPDLSDPLAEATERQRKCFRWRACNEHAASVNFLIGSPTEVAERLTEVFQSGGVGAWKRTARMATAKVIRQLDADNEPRSLVLIGQRLEQAIKSDRDLRTACAGWVSRFLDLADQFGSSIGAGGVDLAVLLRRGYTIQLENDAFEHPALTEDIVALGLAEAKRCAKHVPNGFRLIFEEAGQIGTRIELAAPFFRAGRRRKITVDVLTQAETDLSFHGSDAITSNIATRVYFAQELQPLQRIAADRLGLNYTDLDPANMRDFTAYIAHGKIRRLVHFPKPPKPARSYVSVPTHLTPQSPQPRRIVIEELGRAPDVLPGLPPPRLEVARLLDQIDRSGHCHVWTGKTDRDGYGIVRWNGNWGRVHRVVWELANGPVPRGDNGKALDLDHQCRNRLCCKPDHLEPVTRAENVRRMWAYRARGDRAAI